MPIRMVDDPDSGNSSNDNYPGGGRKGGGGGLVAFIPMILGFLIKRPKFLLLIVAGAAAWYFLGGGKNMLNPAAVSSMFATGGNMDPKVYAEADIQIPLTDNATNPLPDQFSLLKYAPARLNQGSQGSCVAWASSYAARTILYSRETGADPNSVAFSPSFLYNQIKLDNCQGSYIQRAMDKMQASGLVYMKDFAYTDANCDREPDPFLLQKAEDFKIKGFSRLSVDGDESTVDLLAVKQNISQGSPIVIGMMVGGSFMQVMMGQEVWIPIADDYDMPGFGGHAMCVVGYDDNLEGGSFQIMNSWGNDWGKSGVAYVRYKDFKYFVKEAYGLYPMGSIHKADLSRFTVSFGLTDNQSKNYIPLKHETGNHFVTSAIAKGTKFKGEITNSAECYIYIWGQETDGSGYILFPYTPKHSPFCGTTGSRQFPKGQSMLADEVGNRDRMVVVISREPINFKEITEKLSKSNIKDLEKNISNLLDNKISKSVAFSNEQNKIKVDCDLRTQSALMFVVDVNKN